MKKKYKLYDINSKKFIREEELTENEANYYAAMELYYIEEVKEE